MKAQVLTMDAAEAGEVDLDDAIFAIEPRKDILHRVVRWQLAKRRAGTHKTKTRSEVSYVYKKIYRQKGTGGARHGSKGVVQFRHGGTTKGPVVRSHAHDLPKKVRRLGLRMALSAKAGANRLIVVDTAAIEGGKTKSLMGHLEKLGISKALVIDGPEVDATFLRAASNLKDVNVLPSQGANVYDILKHNTLVLTKAGVEALEARLK